MMGHGLALGEIFKISTQPLECQGPLVKILVYLDND